MKRLFLTITNEQRVKLEKHLEMNGYSVEWETDDVINVDEEEISYVKTILYDRYIPFTDDINEQWFGSREIKTKVDTLYNLAREILDMSGDIADYTDEENEILDEIANVIIIYENTFNN